MKGLRLSVDGLTFLAARMSPRWSMRAASTSLTFLFCLPRSQTRQFIRPDSGKGISGVTGAARAWNTAPSRTFLIPISTNLHSSSVANYQSLFGIALYVGLWNLLCVHQIQRQVFCLPRAQRNVLLPL